MWPLIMALGGGLAVHALHKHRRKTPSALIPPPSQTMTRANHGPGRISPQGAAIHGELMTKCVDPRKLVQAAHLFGAEGCPHHAEALMGRAQLIHNMMQGARDIVERSRSGDQHTMAIAKATGERARQGDRQAQLAAWLIEEYSKAHPPTEGQKAA